MKLQGRPRSWVLLTSPRLVRLFTSVITTMLFLGAADIARTEPVNITQGGMVSGWFGWDLPGIAGQRNVLQLFNNTGQHMTVYAVQGYTGDTSIADELCIGLGKTIDEAFNNAQGGPGQPWNNPGASGEITCVWKRAQDASFPTVQFDGSLGFTVPFTVPDNTSFWAWFGPGSDGVWHHVRVYAQPTAQVSQVWRIPVLDFSGACDGTWQYSGANPLTSGYTRHVSGFNVYSVTHVGSETLSVNWGWVGVYDAQGTLLAGGPSSGNAINQGYVQFSVDVPAGGYIAAQSANNCSGGGWDWAVYVNIGPGYTNLALNKPATQSSDPGWGGPASKAVDGNTDGNWTDGSVTHTYFDTQAWWQVDLGSPQAVQSVEVWNRTDCCPDRLSNFNVLLLDSNQAVVGSAYVGGQAGSPTTVALSGTARYVRVQLVGTNYLSLAEVKVWGIPAALTNLALNKPATQSSDPGWGGPASKAVDGNTDGNWADGSVTHTYFDTQAWWQVDLGSPQAVQSAEVWNRTDCCPDRLSNFNVFLLDSNQAVVGSAYVGGQAGSPTTVALSGTARYVRVQLVGTNYLSLAEVKVWGTP